MVVVFDLDILLLLLISPPWAPHDNPPNLATSWGSRWAMLLAPSILNLAQACGVGGDLRDASEKDISDRGGLRSPEPRLAAGRSRDHLAGGSLLVVRIRIGIGIGTGMITGYAKAGPPVLRARAHYVIVTSFCITSRLAGEAVWLTSTPAPCWRLIVCKCELETAVISLSVPGGARRAVDRLERVGVVMGYAVGRDKRIWDEE